MTDLSILIPSRNELFLAKTIEDILSNIEGDTEVIAILDGQWADPPIPDHPRVMLIYHSESIGQRAATNEAAKLSQARFILKCDAHCAFDKGFDVKLMADCEPDWTVIPRSYNLHAFDWQCQKCNNRTYQGPKPIECKKCDNTTEFEMVMVWKPRLHKRLDFAYFDKELRYNPNWRVYEKRPQAQGDIVDVMCSVGACWFMYRDRYWELGGLDEEHGSWGQCGVEISCKSWLSGGRQVVNKKTWYSHLYRTQPGFGFPYRQSGQQVEHARAYSRQLWMENKWEKAVKPLSWLIDKFAPVPGWDVSKGIVWYTDNRLDENIMTSCQNNLLNSANGHRIVSVSLKPLKFGDNIHLPLERGYLTLFKQILAGLEALDTDIVFLAEHDCLYNPSHFDFTPPDRTKVYYNQNVWHLRLSDGHAVYYDAKRTSQLCAYRDVLLDHYRKRVERVEREGFSRRIGFEPGSHNRKERIDDLKSDVWVSENPNIDIKHGHNLTPARWNPAKFRDQRNCQNWKEADEIPAWGKLDQILSEVKNGNVT